MLIFRQFVLFEGKNTKKSTNIKNKTLTKGVNYGIVIIGKKIV